jgi:hypothetical protein
MPSHYGESTSIFRRYQEWAASGVWGEVTKILAELRSENPPQVAPEAGHGWITDPERSPDVDHLTGCETSIQQAAEHAHRDIG